MKIIFFVSLIVLFFLAFGSLYFSSIYLKGIYSINEFKRDKIEYIANFTIPSPVHKCNHDEMASKYPIGKLTDDDVKSAALKLKEKKINSEITFTENEKISKDVGCQICQCSNCSKNNNKKMDECETCSCHSCEDDNEFEKSVH